MGKLSPWEENCHSATQCTQLGQNFTSPASSPVLFSATAVWVGQRPPAEPFVGASQGLALLQCTQTMGLQEMKTQRPQNREKERCSLVPCAPSPGAKGAAQDLLSLGCLIPDRPTLRGPASSFYTLPGAAVMPPPSPSPALAGPSADLALGTGDSRGAS